MEPTQGTTSREDVEPESLEKAMDVDVQPVSDIPVDVGASTPGPSGGSAWYSPWSWYSSAPTPTAISKTEGLNVEETSPMDQDPPATIEVAVFHPPEGQTVEGNSALTASATTIEIPTSTSDRPPETNLIEETITTHRSGWASFFSSRAAGVKMIGYGGVKRDENGAEVMEIDVDEVEGEEKRETGGIEKAAEGQLKGGVLSLTTTSEVTIGAKTTPKSTPAGSKPPSGTNTPILPSSPSSSSALTAKNGAPAEKPKVAVKLKRTASPTPSVKKANTTPPPPNLILPTWGDTFHTAPRNVVPPPPLLSHARGDNVSVGGKLIGKTIKFVSGVLFAKDAPMMSAKGKERERETVQSLLEKERRERFVGIGRELPKTWGVLRAAGWDVDSGTEMRGIGMGAASSTSRESLGGDVDGGLGEEGMSNVLRGCKRVVVIGVHGWFPG